MDIATLLGSYAFPIVCTIAMGFYVRERENKHSELIEKMNDSHTKEVNELKDEILTALNNNTIAITRLCDKMERGDDLRWMELHTYKG